MTDYLSVKATGVGSGRVKCNIMKWLALTERTQMGEFTMVYGSKTKGRSGRMKWAEEYGTERYQRNK